MSTPTTPSTNGRGMSPAMVTAIGVALTAMIAALGGIYVQVQSQRIAAALVASQQDAKLDKIEILVDGTKSAMLRKIAVLLRSLAISTGRATDIKAAEEAEREADEQEARVAAASAANADEPKVP